MNLNIKRSTIKVSTPELLWHGGGTDNGKPDPVYSLDLHPTNILATAGIDASIPPKGSVRLWKIDPVVEGQEFLIELNDHQTVVNSLKFSPNGKLLASASDRQIVIYSVMDNAVWSTLSDMKNLERTWLTPSLGEVYDIQWSPDSCNIIAGAINSRAEIIRVSSRDSLLITGHTSYVQGVAWDPLNQMVVTQSADRSCKIHMIKCKSNAAVKLATRGHTVLKMHGGATDSKNLFADSTVPCFFRRPTFTPDGALLIIPTGVHRSIPPVSQSNKSPGNNSSSSSSSSSSVAQIQQQQQSQSFCTYIVSRNNLSTPIISLIGLEEPSIAVRCNPAIFRLIDYADDENSGTLLSGKYRFIFAVVTISTVYVYDTQHPSPIARIAGAHLATINDATWSSDGHLLVVCSSDGYLSFIRFEQGSLGEKIPREEVPDVIKATLPCVYDFELPTVQVATAPTVAITSTTLTSLSSSPAASKSKEQSSTTKKNIQAKSPAAATCTSASEATIGSVTLIELISDDDDDNDEANIGEVKISLLESQPSQGPAQGQGQGTPLLESVEPVPVAVPGSAGGSATKKRRIIPTMIADLGSPIIAAGNLISSSSASASASASNYSPQQEVVLDLPPVPTDLEVSTGPIEIELVADTSSSGNGNVNGNVKKKKRIAPIFVSSLSDAALSSSSSSGIY